jgi:TPR repeat protein
VARLVLLFAVLGLAAAVPARAADGDRIETKPPAVNVDPQRFGAKPPDMAYGAFQRGYYLTALDLAMPRAEGGDPAAQTLVAEIYAEGLGVARDPIKAAEWYGKAAKQGVPEAEFRYAMVLLDGGQKNFEEASRLMQEAADAGNRFAQFNYAQMIAEREPGPSGLARAFVYYEKAAMAGLPDAEYAMSQAYANGVGGKPKDEREARRWLLLAARQNYDTAQLDLGTWMVEGRGGPVDLKTGFGWLKIAAQGGNVAAENRLAKLYRDGIGTEADKVEAAAWYVLARRAGLSDPGMDLFYSGLSDDDQKKAIERANRLR